MILAKFKKGIFSRFVWFLVSLQIINLSVNTPDKQPYYMPEDLNINDIESLVEWVLEDVLAIDNIIAEHDEPESEEEDSLSKKIYLFFHVLYLPTSVFILPIMVQNKIPFLSICIRPFIDTLHLPPEK